LLVKLTEIEKGIYQTYRLGIDPHDIGDPSFSTKIESGNLIASIREVPEGYHLKYEMHAQIKAPCSTCGEDLEFEVDANGSLTLCLEQPNAHHIVLNADDLDVRFLKDETCDLLQLFDEQVELEMPLFPRHNDKECKGVLEYLEQQNNRDEEESDHSGSPFAVLSSFIEKKK